MPRRFDKRGWNRQFKWLPCSKRHPFPYRLPFDDDFSDGAVLLKQETADDPDDSMSEPSVNSPDILDPDQYFKMVQRRRNRTRQFRELHKDYNVLNPGKRQKISHRNTLKALGAGAAVVGTAAATIFAPEIGLPAALGELRGAMARRVVRSMHKQVMRRIESLNRRGFMKEAGELWKDYQFLQQGGISGRHIVRFLRNNKFKMGFSFTKGLHLSLGP